MSSARTRVLVAAGVGAVCFALVWLKGPWQVAMLSAWNVAAGVLVTWMLVIICTTNSDRTAQVATFDDDSRAQADALLVIAALASLAGIAFGLLKGAQDGGPLEGLLTCLSVLSVVLSWLLVHVIFTLRYAHLYYRARGGIDFNEHKEPDYLDFAYLAFTIGMTYQVSDTDLTSTPIRRAALRHALLSFVFGTSVIAMTINVVASLVQR